MQCGREAWPGWINLGFVCISILFIYLGYTIFYLHYFPNNDLKHILAIHSGLIER